MDLMNETSEVVKRIYLAWEKKGCAEVPRRYLGASIAGHACDRYLFLYFRGVVRENFSGRMYRLFDRGKREEDVFVADLRAIGCEVWPTNPETGAQWAVSDLGGHFGGHLDGVATGIPDAPKTPHVLEFKTHNDASFRKLEKEGVALAKPMHYAQMQIYMGQMGLTRALYLAVNKDTDELHAERIKFDKDFYTAQMTRIARIIDASDAERCAMRADDFRCKACPARDACWHKTGTFFGAGEGFDCRTCCHATADTSADGAVWTCRKGHTCVVGTPCTCRDHLVLPVLVDHDGIEDAGMDYITFRVGADLVTNGTKDGQFTSVELAKLPKTSFDGGKLAQIKEALPKSKVVQATTLWEKYKDAEKLFTGTIEALDGWMRGQLMDWSQPNKTETCTNGTTFCEFGGEVCVAVNKDQNHADVRGFMPF